MPDIVVRVPKPELEHFWHEPPAGSDEFWTLQNTPKKLAIDEHIWFAHDGHLVARAKVSRIESGEWICSSTGRPWRGCHVAWAASDFQKLEPPIPLARGPVRGFAYLDESTRKDMSASTAGSGAELVAAPASPT